MYLPLIVADKSRPDYVGTVDVDPSSSTYSQARQSLAPSRLLACMQPVAVHARLSMQLPSLHATGTCKREVS